MIRRSHQRSLPENGPSSDPDSLSLALARARLDAVRGDRPAAIARLRDLVAAHASHVHDPAWLTLGEIYRDAGELEEAIATFRVLERRLPPGRVSETALNLGLAWQSIEHPSCAAKVYTEMLRDFPFEAAETLDPESLRLAAIAALRLGDLTVEENLDEAWTWWRRALGTGVAEVAPLAALALATQIGPHRLFPARIEELFRQVVEFDHPEASPQAAYELGCLFADRLQDAQADEFLGYASDSLHPQWAPAAEGRLAAQRSGSNRAPAHGPPTDPGPSLQEPREKLRSAVIVGAGTGGQYLFDAIRRGERPYRICGFLDDEATELPDHLGLSVLGTIPELPRVLEEHQPDEVLMAIPTAPGAARWRVVRACSEAGISLRNLPTMHELHQDHDLFSQLRPVRIEETFGANPVQIDRRALAGLHEQVVLLVGAGTIGSQIARRLAAGCVGHLTVFDRDEGALDRLVRELTVERGFSRVLPLLGDIHEAGALESALELGPTHVYFAAGSTHPRLFEDNIVSAARSEVLGAIVFANALAGAGTPRLLYLSSSYAAQASTPFAAAKAISELAVHDACRESPTAVSTLRLGNVYRSPGSPLEAFERQAELGGPLTVPGAAVAGRFLSGARVAELCLWAGRIGADGERLAIDGGETLNLREVAKRMVRLGGDTVDISTPVDHSPVAGEWSGPALVWGGDEARHQTEHNELIALGGRQPEPGLMAEVVARLAAVIGDRDPVGVRRSLLDLAASVIGGAESVQGTPDSEPEPQTNVLS